MVPKRFTESDKWRDKWFRALGTEYKLAWMYILDNCDVAGVLDLDAELANFQIGSEIEWDDFVDACGESRIHRLPNGKLHVVRFVEYQYGKLSEQCRPHVPVIAKLKEHGISDVVQKGEFKYGNVSDKRRVEVFERDGNVCCYCGDKFEKSQLEPDHVVPKIKGGNDSKDNLVAACISCNGKKSDKDLLYFIKTLEDPAAVMKRLSQRLPERVFNTLKEQDKDKDKEKVKDKEQDKDTSAQDCWLIPERLDTEKVRGLLKEYEGMRVRIRKPIKSLEASSKVLTHFDDEDHLVYALETCIANEYQGLKADYRRPTNVSGKAKSKFGPGQTYQPQAAFGDGF